MKSPQQQSTPICPEIGPVVRMAAAAALNLKNNMRRCLRTFSGRTHRTPHVPADGWRQQRRGPSSSAPRPAPLGRGSLHSWHVWHPLFSPEFRAALPPESNNLRLATPGAGAASRFRTASCTNTAQLGAHTSHADCPSWGVADATKWKTALPSLFATPNWEEMDTPGGLFAQ